MKCFYASTEDAIGICKSCGRGLSAGHLTEMDKGLACRDRCEDEVKSLIALIEQDSSSSDPTNQILKRSSLTAYGSGVFLTVMGIVFTLKGLSDPRLDFILYLGVGFIAYGSWTFVRARRYAAIIARLPDSKQISTDAP